MSESVQKEGRDPSTLADDIYSLLESVDDHEVSEENVAWAGEVFMDLLRSRLKKREEKKGEGVIRFSALGKPDRQMWYLANKPDVSEKISGKQLFKFLYGDAIEVLMLFLAKEAGHTVTHEQHEVEVDGVHGHMDAVIDGVPVDVKSASAYSFEKFKSGDFIFNDPFGYIKQLSGYANVIDKTDRAGFLVADKVNGGITFAEIDEYTIKGNPPAPRIAELREIVNNREPPARCYPDVPEGKSGNKKLGIECSYCPFKDDCWSDANNGVGLRKFFYSRGPVWLTEVKREPKVEEV